LFFVTLFSLLFSLGVRAFLFRKDNPPLAFLLVAHGIFCAFFGSAVQVISAVSFTLLPEWCLPLAKLLLYQGFLLFPHHWHRRLFDCHVFFRTPEPAKLSGIAMLADGLVSTCRLCNALRQHYAGGVFYGGHGRHTLARWTSGHRNFSSSSS